MFFREKLCEKGPKVMHYNFRIVQCYLFKTKHDIIALRYDRAACQTHDCHRDLWKRLNTLHRTPSLLSSPRPFGSFLRLRYLSQIHLGDLLGFENNLKSTNRANIDTLSGPRFSKRAHEDTLTFERCEARRVRGHFCLPENIVNDK